MRKPRINTKKIKLIVATRFTKDKKTLILPLDIQKAGLVNADMRKEVYFGR